MSLFEVDEFVIPIVDTVSDVDGESGSPLARSDRRLGEFPSWDESEVKGSFGLG